MRAYKRLRVQGGTYFFTLTLAERRGNDLLVRHVSALRTAFHRTLVDHPVAIEAIVVLPDHLHCIWRLPAGDDDFPTRWRLIKSRFARAIPLGEPISASRARRSEHGLWQRRYWEHAIRDERDFRQHMDYIHYNPVKHGYVDNPKDWPFSSLHRLVANGLYEQNWAVTPPWCIWGAPFGRGEKQPAALLRELEIGLAIPALARLASGRFSPR